MKLDDVKKLHQKKYRSQYGYYLVEGEHLILELQKAANTQTALTDITLYVTDGVASQASGLSQQFEIQVISEKKMAQISDTKTPQGIIARVPIPKITTQLKPSVKSVYLHQVQDPGNLGTILRSLAWFGDFQLLLSPNSVDPYNPKVVRSSMGAIFHVPIELDVELPTLEQRFQSFAYLDMQGENIKHPTFADYQCYLFGNEARGVPKEALVSMQAQPFTIAGSGKIDSLNLASAVNICLYQLSC